MLVVMSPWSRLLGDAMSDTLSLCWNTVLLSVPAKHSGAIIFCDENRLRLLKKCYIRFNDKRDIVSLLNSG